MIIYLFFITNYRRPTRVSTIEQSSVESNLFVLYKIPKFNLETSFSRFPQDLENGEDQDLANIMRT